MVVAPKTAPNKRRRYLPASAIRWRAVRLEVWRRDKGQCQICRCDLRGARWEVHHVTPRCEGGQDNPENLLLACVPCHRKETNELLAKRAHERRFNPNPEPRQRTPRMTASNRKNKQNTPNERNTRNITMSSLTVSKSGNGTWTPAPVGKWQAVCVDVRDEGMHANPFKDNEGNPQKPQRKVSLHFQLNAPRDESNRLPMISKWFTFSLHERAGLSKFLCEWFECTYSSIPEDFDLETLVGQNARVRILHEAKADGSGDRAVIQAIERWEGEPMVADNFTRKPGQGSVEGGQQPQAVAPNPAQALPPTNRAPQPPIVPNAAPSMPAPADYRPEGLAMPNAAQQAKQAAREMAKGNVQAPNLAPQGNALPADGEDDPFEDEQPTLQGMPVAQEANTAFAR